MSHELIFGFIGALISMYYKRKSEARAAAEAQGKARERELRMELMRQRGYIFHGPETEIEAEASDA
ncbi:MAG: hypothetical protein ACK5NE_08080 [Brachymonas sp.]